MWVITAAIFATAALSAVIGGVWRIYGIAGFTKPVWPWVAYAGALFVGFAVMSNRVLPSFLAEPQTRFTALYTLGFHSSAWVLKGLAVSAVCAVLVTSWSSFLFDTKDDAHLGQQLATLRWSLHAATFVLVAGVLHVYACIQWPSSFMGEDAAAAIQSGARVFSLAVGAVFSTLLLLIYIPGAKVLVAEARVRQSADPAGSANIEEMLKEHGFDASPTQQIVRFAQPFTPLLIAPLGAEILGLLG